MAGHLALAAVIIDHTIGAVFMQPLINTLQYAAILPRAHLNIKR